MRGHALKLKWQSCQCMNQMVPSHQSQLDKWIYVKRGGLTRRTIHSVLASTLLSQENHCSSAHPSTISKVAFQLQYPHKDKILFFSPNQLLFIYLLFSTTYYSLCFNAKILKITSKERDVSHLLHLFQWDIVIR